jgi:hypothetical protein
MTILMSRVANAINSFRRAYLDSLFAAVLVGCLLLTTGVNATPSSQELGQAVHRRVEATDQTDRPKTTGEFLDEARGDVPIDERLKNITRDSAEAFKKLGEEYSPNVGQAARDLRDSASNSR